jgi:hypothetical protein
MLEPGAWDGVLKIKRLGHSIRPHATTLNGQVGLQAIPTTQHPLGTKTPDAANTAGVYWTFGLRGGNSAVYGGSRGASIVVSLGLMPGACLYNIDH